MSRNKCNECSSESAGTKNEAFNSSREVGLADGGERGEGGQDGWRTLGARHHGVRVGGWVGGEGVRHDETFSARVGKVTRMSAF